MVSRSTKRYAYCKNGDVVAQLNTLGPCPEHVPDGGPDTYAANFLHYACGYPVLLVSYCEKKELKKAGNVIAKTFRKKYRNKVLRAIASLNIFIQTLSALLQFKPTHIMCAATGSPLWACFLVSRIRSAPFFHSRHARVSAKDGSIIEQLIETLDAFVIRRASAVICHGPYLKGQMLELGVDPSRLHEFNISYRYLLDKTCVKNGDIPDISAQGRYRCILFVGTVSKQKGVIDLYEGSKKALHNNKNIRLVYVGKGPDLSLLREKLKDEKLQDQILLLGHINHHYLPFLIRQCTFLVAPTRSSYPESRCKAAIEGMILGKPVIAPRFGPFPYVFKHGHNGLLFEPDSVPDLAAKIHMLLDDHSLYLTLVKGAEEEGKRLLDSPKTFQQALKLIFKDN